MRKETEAPIYRRLISQEGKEEYPFPRGYIPMLVGSEKSRRRFLVHTRLFKHPLFMKLLEMAAEEFGYEQQGILKIPVDVEYFRVLVDVISTAK